VVGRDEVLGNLLDRAYESAARKLEGISDAALDRRATTVGLWNERSV
jgi:hypothetical protein